MIRVYRYGLLAPTKQAHEVRDQMRRAHRYRNALVEIERGRRAAVRLALSTGDVAACEREVAAAEETVQNAVAAIKAARAQTRSRSETSELRDALARARVIKRDAVDRLREARRRQREAGTHAAELERIEGLAKALAVGAYNLSGLYWGTRALIDDEMHASRKMPIYDDPHFVRWTGEGSVGIYVHASLGTVDEKELFGAGLARFKIAPLDERKRTTLSLRIGSEGRDPIWASWPMVMHRPIPEGARVTAAKVTLRKLGTREEWAVHLTCDTGESSVCSEDAPIVAVNLGWRVVPEGIRVATWRAEGGRSGHLVLGPDVLGALRKPQELRSVRDENFNAAREKLASWLDTRTSTPEWMPRNLRQWRSPARLAALALRWRKERFSDDAEGFDALEAWRYHDHHLYNWECSQREKSLRRRRDVYRNFAAQLRGIGRIVVGKLNLAEAAKVPEVNEQAPIHGARSNRQLVAVSELALALAGETVDAVNVSHECHVCGTVDSYDASAMLHHGCSGCGVVWDQDENAAILLLRRACEQRNAARDAGIARAAKTPEKAASKWVRAKAEKAKREVARNPSSNVLE